jgi:hypothetical protein
MPERAELRAGLAGLALLLAAGCGAPLDPEAAAENPLSPIEGQPRYAVDALGTFTPRAQEQAPEAPLPLLDFQEFSEGLPPMGEWSGPPLLFDLNADGSSELVASSCEEGGYTCWIAPGGGRALWTWACEGLPRGIGCGAAGSGDLDGDGKPDLALTSALHGLRIYLGDGQLRWREPPWPLADTAPIADLACGDLDGDGGTDIAWLGSLRGGLQILYGGKPGGLRPAPDAKLLPENAFGRALELADLDDDGRSDIVVATDARVRAFLAANPAGPGWRELSQGLPAPASPAALMALCCGRFTADSRPQIAVCSQPDPGLPPSRRNTIGLYRYSAALGAWEQFDSGLPRGDRYFDLRAADFDADGKLDLVALSLEHGAAIYLGDGKGGFRASGRLAGVHGRGHLAVGRIDADALPDIALSVKTEVRQPEGGGVRAFINSPAVWKPR